MNIKSRYTNVIRVVSSLALFSIITLSAFAGMKNHSMADMQSNNYYGADGQFGTTFSLKDEDGTDTGLENIPLADIYRQNIAINIPDGYTETSNGNFQLIGNQYAIVDDASKLNASFSSSFLTDYNHLVLHNVARNQNLLTLTIKNYDISDDAPVYLSLTIESVFGLSNDAAAKFGLFLGSDKIDEVVVKEGDYYFLNNKEIKKSKLSGSFELELRRIDNDANADNCVIAISEVLMTGKASVVSGVKIKKTVDEGETLGTPVTIVASAAASIAENDVKWERRSSDGNWEELTNTGLKLVDIPQKPGDTYYRAKYYDGVWNFSNEVNVTRIMGCAATSKVLWSEDFGTLKSEQSRNSNGYVTSSYNYVASGNVNDGCYAVVANPRTAGTDGGSDEKSYWFRNIYDHTQGTPVSGVYGGMLLVNCKSGQQSNDIVMERKIRLGCKNTFVNFSAWFANAGWDRGKGDNNPINMIIRVLSPSRSEVATINVVAQKNDGWKNGTVSFYNKDWEDEDLTLEIVNNGVGGGGNDVLIDDISFTICRPDVRLSASIQGVAEDDIEDIRTSCGGTVSLTADPDDTYKSIYSVQNPYYKWLKSIDNNTWGDAGKAGAGSAYKIFDVVASGTRTFYKCIIGPNQSDVDGYISNPDAYTCSSVAEASYASVRCPADVDLTVTPSGCNDYTLLFSSASVVSGVNWFIGSDECGWRPIDGLSGTQVSYTLSADDIPSGGCKIYFKGVATDDATLWAASSQYFEYKEISLSGALNTTQTIGCDIVYDLTAEMKRNGVTAPASKYEFKTSVGIEIQATSSNKCQVKKADGYGSADYTVMAEGCSARTYIDMTCPQINYSNICNKYTFTLTGATSSDVIKWSYGNDNAGWTPIQGESKSTLVVEDVSKLFPKGTVGPFMIQAIISGGAGVAGLRADKNVDVYSLTMLEPQVVAGDNCSKQFSLAAECLVNYEDNDNALYFYEKGKPEILCERYSAVFSPEPCETPTIDYSTTFYVTTENGCYAEKSVDVGCLKLSETHKCNQYTFTVTDSKGGPITWEYGVMDSYGIVNWTKIDGVTGSVLDKDISTLFDIAETGERYVKASESPVLADSINVTQYLLSLKAEPSVVANCGDATTLTADMKPMSLGIYSFYKKGETSAIFEGPANSCSTGPLYSSATFIVRNQGCEAEVPVTVDLVWPTVFTPYTAGSTNVKFEVCAKSLKIFDRNGNMIADIQGNTWDGYCTTGSSSGNMAMPGVYFYVATLDDDSIKKGTVEIFKSVNNK